MHAPDCGQPDWNPRNHANTGNAPIDHCRGKRISSRCRRCEAHVTRGPQSGNQWNCGTAAAYDSAASGIGCEGTEAEGQHGQDDFIDLPLVTSSITEKADSAVNVESALTST